MVGGLALGCPRCGANGGARTSTGAANNWLQCPSNDYVMTLYQYTDLLTESEPKDLAQLKLVLGNMPTCSLCVELRRSKGIAAVTAARDFVSAALESFGGVSDDARGDLYNLNEVINSKGGEPFLGWLSTRMER
jgi:hypothetical protein